MRILRRAVQGEGQTTWPKASLACQSMSRQSVPEQKSRRIHRTAGGVGQKALAVAVITQAVLDLRQSGEVSPQSAADAACFLMERLWRDDALWSTLALGDDQWLTATKVDQVVAQRIAPKAAALLPSALRARLVTVHDE